MFLDEDFRGSFLDRWSKIDASTSLDKFGLIAITFWSIWNDRNKRAHGEEIPSIQFRSKWIKDYLEASMRANQCRSSIAPFSQHVETQASRSLARWRPPTKGFWKINTDAACFSSPSKSSIGAVGRDSKGKIMFALANVSDISLEAHLAELWALFEGVKMAVLLGCTRLRVESDCKLAINFINKKVPIWKDVEAIAESIWSLLP